MPEIWIFCQSRKYFAWFPQRVPVCPLDWPSPPLRTHSTISTFLLFCSRNFFLFLWAVLPTNPPPRLRFFPFVQNFVYLKNPPTSPAPPPPSTELVFLSSPQASDLLPPRVAIALQSPKLPRVRSVVPISCFVYSLWLNRPMLPGGAHTPDSILLKISSSTYRTRSPPPG